jgi:hypothetical protein
MGDQAKRRAGDGVVAFHRLGCSGEAEAALPTTIIVVEH